MKNHHLTTNKNFWLAHLALLIVSIIPIWFYQHLIFVDYHNHLARAYIIRDVLLGIGKVSNYLLEWKISHSLGFEFIYFFVAYLFDPYTSGKIAISLIILINIIGTITLSKIINKKLCFETLILYLGVYNFTLYYGFINFNLSVGLCFLSLALYIKCENKFFLKHLVFCICLYLIFFVHVLGAFFLGFLVGTRLLQKTIVKNISLKELLVNYFILLLICLPVAYFLLGSSTNLHGFESATDKFNLNIFKKLFNLISSIGFTSTFTSYSSIILIACLPVSILFLYKIYKNKLTSPIKVKFPKFSHLSIIGLFILVFLVPNRFIGVWGMSYRPAVYLLFFIAATITITFTSKKNHFLFMSIIFSYLLISQVNVYKTISKCQHVFEDYFQIIKKVEQSKSILTLSNINKKQNKATYCPAVNFEHLANYGIIEKDAFIPELFSGSPPIKVTKNNIHKDTTATKLITAEMLEYETNISFNKSHKLDFQTLDDWHNKFDYLMVYGGLNNTNLSNLTKISEHGIIELYQVTKD